MKLCKWLLSFEIISVYFGYLSHGEISKTEVLSGGISCKDVYDRAKDTTNVIDFASSIGNVTCDPGPKGLVRYHCLVNEHKNHIQFCSEWIWIEKGLCPKLYSVHSVINPEKCRQQQGCPMDKYQSHNYYNYSGCFDQETRDEDSAKDNDIGSQDSQHSNEQLNGGQVAGIVIAIFVVAIIAFGGVWFLIGRRNKGANSGQQDNEQGIGSPEDKPLITTQHEMEQKWGFIQERPYKAIEKCIKKGRHIVLTGLPGSGAFTLLQQIKSSHQGNHWHTEKHGDINLKCKKVPFVTFDQSGLQKLMEKHSYEDILTEMRQIVGETTVIVNVDYDWYNKFPEKIRQCLGETYDVIDLSSEKYKLNKSERRKYLDSHCKKIGVTEEELSAEKRDAVVLYKESNKGFILLCGELIKRKNSKHFDKPEDYLRMIDSKKDHRRRERPLQAAIKKLREGRHIMVTALPGEGTTTFIEHLVSEFPTCHRPKHKTLRFNQKKKGPVIIDHDIVKDIFKSDNIENERNKIQASQGCIFNVKYKWFRKHLDEFRSKIEIPFDAIDLSGDEFGLNDREKLAIINQLCNERDITMEKLSDTNRLEISSFRGINSGFVQLLIDFLDEDDFVNPIQRMKELDDEYK